MHTDGANLILDCGGKRSATPLSHAPGGLILQSSSPARKRRRRVALPAQSKMPTPFAPIRAIRVKPLSESVFIGVHPWLNLPA